MFLPFGISWGRLLVGPGLSRVKVRGPVAGQVLGSWERHHFSARQCPIRCSMDERHVLSNGEKRWKRKCWWSHLVRFLLGGGMINAAAPPGNLWPGEAAAMRDVGDMGNSASGDEAVGDARALPPPIIIEQGIHFNGVIYQIEIRNAGGDPVDVTFLTLTDSSGVNVVDSKLELVRGSVELCPGEKALILTHSAVDPSDNYRMLFGNVYRFSEASDVLSFTDGLSLKPSPGVTGIPLDPKTFDVVGKCCTDEAQQACRCGPGPTCGECETNCWSIVGSITCCDVLGGCCFKAGDEGPCFEGCPSGALTCE